MRISIFLLALLLAISSTLYAQNVAQLSGSVKDQSGAVLPGVEVKVTQTETGLTRDAVSDETGSYTLPNLPLGPYRLEAALPGFRTYVQSGIILQVGSNPTVNVVLQVGAVNEQVEVTADAALVETRSTGVGQVITNQSVLELPLNGRNVTELLMLSGAATNTFQGGNFVSNRQYPVVAIAIAGGSPGGTFYSMDGGSHNDPGNNLNLPVPFPDALQEFKTETGAVPARFGQHANAVVNLVTKSGTNTFHGSGFEFVRNGSFNARNAYALKRDTLKRNQFGGTLGGPIMKNKLFFFGGYQGTTTRSDPSELQAFVPTAAMLAGDFRAYASPACNSGNQRTLTAPAGAGYSFVNNTVSPAVFDPVAVRYAKYLPVSTDPCGRYFYGFPTPSSDKQILVRGDYQRSDTHSIFGRYFRAVYDAPNFYDGNALTTTSIGVRNEGESLVIGDTYAFSPTMINSFRLSYLTPRNDRFAVPFFSPDQLGAKIVPTPFAGNFTSLGVSPGFNIGSGSTNNAHYNYWVYGVSNDLDLIRGNHNFSVGALYLWQIEETRNSQYSNGQISFNGQRTGLAISDFLLGEVATIIQGYDGVMNDRKHYLGLYYQDAWKATQRLTINYGVRWEPNWPLYNVDKHVSLFDEAAFKAGKKSSVYVNAPAGLTFPGDPGYPGRASTNKDLSIFNPRVGLVYDPRGKGTEVIRAAYGIFSDSQPLFDHTTFASNPPWGGQVTLQAVKLADPYANYPGGNPFPFVLSPTIQFPPAGAYALEKLHAKQVYTQQWNLSVQKQVGTDWSVTLSYLGNKLTHQWTAGDINYAVFVPGGSTLANAQSRRRLNFINPTEGRFFANITQVDDGGNGNYNGAVVSLQKRLSRGYSILSNYTWSHCINDTDARQIQSNGGGYTDPNNRRLDRAACSSDVRQLFNLSGVLASPRFGSRAMQTIAGGWQLSTIYRVQTGAAFTVVSGRDNTLNLQGSQRPNQIANPVLDNPTPDAWFNKAAFVANGPGEYGTTGRNSLRGPGAWNVDMALTRKFSLKEMQTLELRAEAFNLFNHTRLGIPVSNLTSSDFGRVRSAQDPRILQFALKYVF
jgi:carboxypeptidase family protein